jgi:helicase
VAREWTRVGDAPQVADKHDCYSFEVERLRESLERLLTAMYAIFPVSDEGEEIPPHAHENTPLRERVRAARAMISGGLDEFGVTLTLVEGIGTKTARRLLSEGVADIEQLARLRTCDFPGLKGVTTNRLKRWVSEAKRVALTRSAFAFREAAPHVNAAPTGWLPGVDPYRLRRALDLRVASADGGTLLVIGGLDPHVVRVHAGDPICDCVDAARGNVCKHALAVRMHMGDKQLKTLANKLARIAGGEDRIDVFELWSDVRGQSKRRLS